MASDPGQPMSEPVAWPDAFRVLYEARWGPMVRLAYVLTGGDAAAEELVQDAFLRIRDRLDRIQNPPSYLRTAVVNACLSHGRRRARERRVAATTSTAGLAHLDQPDELRDALVHLPRRQRAAVVLRYYEDLPEVQIAEVLGCSVSAVKSLLHRALGDLREVIER